MDQPQALDFVFGGTVTRDDWDEAGHEERRRLVEAHLDLRSSDETIDDRDVALMLRLAVVEQLLSGTPPNTWAAAQRLAADGMERDAILGQLTMVLVHALRATLGDAALADEMGAADDDTDDSPVLGDLVGETDNGTRHEDGAGEGTTIAGSTHTDDATAPTATADATEAATADVTDTAKSASPAPDTVDVTAAITDPDTGDAIAPADPAAGAAAIDTAGVVAAAADSDSAEATATADPDSADTPGGFLDADRPSELTAATDTRYFRWLAELPLPDGKPVGDALMEIAAAHKVLPTDELVGRVLEQLGYSRDNQPAQRHVERVEEHLAALTDIGPLAWLPGKHTVHVDALTTDIVLTHRLTEAERDADALAVSFDLGGFRRTSEPVHDGVEIDVHPSMLAGMPAAWRHLPLSEIERLRDANERGYRDLRLPLASGEVAWIGPDGWLDPYEPGTVLAIRVEWDPAKETRRLGDRRAIYIEVLPDAPPVDDGLVAAVHQAYDTAVAEPGLPVSGEELLLGLLAADHATFDKPQAPLSDLVEAAGLQRRAGEVAHDAVVWAQARVAGSMRAVVERTDDRRASRAAIEVLTDAAHIAEGVPVDLARRRSTLNHLRDPEVLGIVADVCLDIGSPADEARRFAAELLDAAHGSPQASTARYIAALAAERAAELDVAEQQLELAVESDTHNLAAVDRLAWYASDRGDAPRAVRLWRRCEAAGEVVGDIRTVEPFADPSSLGAEVGRNDPCWCGSGRKHKHCHLGVVPQPPLAERVPWLTQKAVDYIRRSRIGRAEVVSVAYALNVEGDDVRDTLADPLAMDLMLVEGGWFELFLVARGQLLPDDEAELAAEWLTVPRSIYEVTAVEPGVGVTLKDLRTGDEIEMRQPEFAIDNREGRLWCGRAVPDSEAHVFLGAYFLVMPFEKQDLFPLLDEGDPFKIAEWRSEVVEQIREDEEDSRRPPPTEEDMHRLRDSLEERWCDEPHADLDGRTPREAAADPSSAEQLDQVIAAVEHEAVPPPMDILNKRPTRLRELLNLNPAAS